jgi:hypothetical protein
MGFHHRSVEQKDLSLRQIEATKDQTAAIYALVDTLRDKWEMPALPLRPGEAPSMRPARHDHPRRDDDEDDSSEGDGNGGFSGRGGGLHIYELNLSSRSFI